MVIIINVNSKIIYSIMYTIKSLYGKKMMWFPTSKDLQSKINTKEMPAKRYYAACHPISP